jgi:hypothetical protein
LPRKKEGVVSDTESFWEPQPSPGGGHDPDRHPYRPPAPDARVRGWEERNGLRLPASLAEALTVHDGGRVRGTDLEIESMGGFSVLDDGGWDGHFSPGNQEGGEFEGVDRGKLVLIGECWGCGVVLDYRRGPESNVLAMHHNLGGVLRDEGCGTFDEFLRGLRR